MSGYFYQRIKNLPTTANNSNTNYSRFIQEKKPTIKTEVMSNISDDELLESAFKFEQTSEYKQAEEKAKKEKGGHMLLFVQLESRTQRNN